MAGLPLAIAFAGVGVSLMGAMGLTHWLDIQQMAPVLGAMLGLAVGIDYALFIVNRHRRQLADVVRDGRTDHPRGDPAQHRARHRHGWYGGGGRRSNGDHRPGGAAGVRHPDPDPDGPARRCDGHRDRPGRAHSHARPCLSLAGRRAVPRKVAQSSGAPHRDGWPEKWVDAVTRRAPAAIVAVVIVMGALAVPAMSLRLGLPDGGSESPRLDGLPCLRPGRRRVRHRRQRSDPGLGLRRGRRSSARTSSASRPASAREIAAVDGVRDVLPIGVSEDRRTIAFQVVSEEGPSAETTVDLVHELREDVSHRAGRRRRRARRHRPGRRQHRGLRAAGRRAAALHRARHRALAGAADDRLPLRAGADPRHRRLPAVGRRQLRCRRRGLPVGLARRRLRRAQPRRRHELHADAADRHPVRAGDGLPDVPRLRHARVLRARPGCARRPCGAGSPPAPEWSPRRR